MGVSVAFDYQTWRARYPEFTDTVTSDVAQMFFDEATLYLRNDGSGPAKTAGVQSALLNMLVAHLAQLNIGTAAQPASAIVGRVTSASEGSVSVSADSQYPSGTPQWFQQTRYGSSYWSATAAYRTMHYRVGPRRMMNPFPFR